MKGIIVIAFLPVVSLLGLVVAVLNMAQSRTQANAYGAQFATPLAQILMQGVAVAALALVFIVGLVVLERRRVSRPRLRRRRRAPRASSRAYVAVPEPAMPAPVVEAPARRPIIAEAALVGLAAPDPIEAVTAVEPLLEDIVVTDVVVHLPASLETAAVIPVAVPPAAVGIPSDPLSHWGLREPAFDNAPTSRFLYLSPAHSEALFRLRYAIRHRKGGAMLTGTSGCGKTTLARALVRELDATRFDVALVSNPRLTATGLLQEILYQLRAPVIGKDKPSLVRALEARLVENLRCGRDTVVIVDEAQMIEDDAVFNELRLLLNFQTNDRFLLSLVLSGSDELLEALRRQPHLAQRCGVRASLEPLDREQTAHYVRHRLVTAGREAETLTEDAVDELFTATGGTPRVINAVCDLTLVVGAAAGVRCVDGDLVRRVAGDLTEAA